MSECDHIIGVNLGDRHGGFLRASEAGAMVALLRRGFEGLKVQGYANPDYIRAHENYTDRQFLEDEYDLFKFCPECGAGLNDV